MSDKAFEDVADTLYTPLTARVYVSKRLPEYFFDPKSLELKPVIPDNSIQTGSNEYTTIASAARYHNLDEMARAYIAAHPACDIVNASETWRPCSGGSGPTSLPRVLAAHKTLG